MESVLLWFLVALCTVAFVKQIAHRVRLVAQGTGALSISGTRHRIHRFVVDVLLQRRTIVERPLAGVAHALVFWAFLAFSGYTIIEFLRGLAIADVTGTRWFTAYRWLLAPFAAAALVGIVLLLVRRAVLRPIALGATVSVESLVIGTFIAILMITFLATFAVDERAVWGRANWWGHMLIILVFMSLIPASKHFHILLSPLTVFLRSPEIGFVRNLDFERDEVGLEVIRDLTKKNVLDALSCVECGRCQVNCPAWGAGKELNPKMLILQTQDALVAGKTDARLVDVYTDKVLWQCTTCGACENQCPVGIEHVPLLVGARRGLVSNGEAPPYLSGLYNNLERRQNVWGLSYEQRQRFVATASVESFDSQKHEWLVWLGCAGAFEADFQKSLKALFAILQSRGVRFGVLAKECCTGDTAKRTGNEYLFQGFATANIDTLKGVGARKIITSCPHCLQALGSDYRQFGLDVQVVHSAEFVGRLTEDMRSHSGEREKVTYHDPCYLGRYAGRVDEPRTLLTRFGGDVAEPERNRTNPYCCGAGGGLLFADKEEEPGGRISDVHFRQLQATGAGTVVTACPFCSVMLKGAQTTAPGGDAIRIVDLMTFVKDRLPSSQA